MRKWAIRRTQVNVRSDPNGSTASCSRCAGHRAAGDRRVCSHRTAASRAGLQGGTQDERKRRESLEARLNQLVEENRKARAAAEEADRHGQIRTELQRTGISKIDLAFRAMKDEIVRAEDGRLQARGADGKSLQDYVTSFVQDNPELLPARIAGGSGAQNPARQHAHGEGAGISLESIRPGMSKDELEKVRQHISKLAAQALRGA